MGIEMGGHREIPDRNSLEALGLLEENLQEGVNPLQGNYRKHKFYEHEADLALIELVRHWGDRDDPKNLRYVTHYAEAVAGGVVSGLQMLDKLQHLREDIFPEKEDPVLKKAAEVFMPKKF